MTGSHIKARALGDNALGVTLLGDPRKPEPALFVVEFPGGHVEISRTSDGKYWVHATANRAEQCHAESGLRVGRIDNARIDYVDPVSTVEPSHREGAWHMAVLVGVQP